MRSDINTRFADWLKDKTNATPMENALFSAYAECVKNNSELSLPEIMDVTDDFESIMDNLGI